MYAPAIGVGSLGGTPAASLESNMISNNHIMADIKVRDNVQMMICDLKFAVEAGQSLIWRLVSSPAGKLAVYKENCLENCSQLTVS